MGTRPEFWAPLLFRRSLGSPWIALILSDSSCNFTIRFCMPPKTLVACWDATIGFSTSGKPDSLKALAISFSAGWPGEADGTAPKIPWAWPCGVWSRPGQGQSWTLDPLRSRMTAHTRNAYRIIKMACNGRPIENRFDVEILNLALFFRRTSSWVCCAWYS